MIKITQVNQHRGLAIDSIVAIVQQQRMFVKLLFGSNIDVDGPFCDGIHNLLDRNYVYDSKETSWSFIPTR
jgi:hypothetical protein